MPKTIIGFVDLQTSTDSSSHTYFSISNFPARAIPMAVFARDGYTYILCNSGFYTQSFTVSVMKEMAIGGGYGWGLVTGVSCKYSVMYIIPE